MLRVSLFAIAALALAGCDDDSETAVEETGAEVEVAVEETAEETTEAAAEVEETAEAAVDETAEETTEAAAEGEETADEAAEETTETAAEGEETAESSVEETTVLTSDSPAVETNIVTEPETDEAAAEPEAEGETEAATTAAEDGSEDPMERYRDWVVGRWAESADACESTAVVMEESAMSLPGGVTCEAIDVASAGGGTLAVTGSSCEGADLDEVEIEVTQAGDNLAFSRNGNEAELVRCQ